MTEDNSVGLYDNVAGDILHSKTGAKREAFDKFIKPSLSLINDLSELNILDLCSGVGYNLKAVLTSLENKTANIFSIDINKELIMLSPFINDSYNDIELELYILSQIIDYGFTISDIYDYISKLDTIANRKFLYPDMTNLIEFLFNGGYDLYGQPLNYQFVHNIYYKYISNNIKYDIKSNKYNNSKINYMIGDARSILKSSDLCFDLVFLDAYSPHKDPTLWTYDFLELLKSKMNNNSILLSYSKSIPFRSALVELGFCVGKTYLDNIDMGTVASLNNNYISNPLQEFDYKLINTTSGIFYRDIGLSTDSKTILFNRQTELKNSGRLSRTQFDKYYR